MKALFFSQFYHKLCSLLPGSFCYWKQVCMPKAQWRLNKLKHPEFGAEKVVQDQTRKQMACTQENQNSLMIFREKYLKAKFGAEASGCVTFLWLVDGWGERVVLQESCVQHGSHHPPPGGSLGFLQNLKVFLCIFLLEELGLCPMAALLLLDCSSSVSASLPFPD